MASDTQAYCDWCYGPLTDDDRRHSQALTLDAEQSWACEVCIASDRTCEPPEGWEGNPDMWLKPVFLFDGLDVVAFPSRERAEGYVEVFDIGGYVFIDAQGTVLAAEADNYRVRLSPTDEHRSDELRTRLRAYLDNERVLLDSKLAEYPSLAAALMLQRGRRQGH